MNCLQSMFEADYQRLKLRKEPSAARHSADMDERPSIPTKLGRSLCRLLAVSSWGPGACWFVLFACLAGTFLVWRVTRGQADERVAEQFRSRVERTYNLRAVL